MRVITSMLGIAGLLLGLVNCSPKSGKSVSTSSSSSTASTSSSSSSSSSSSTTVYTPSLSSALTVDEIAGMKAEYSDLGAEQLAKGRTIYESSCKKCHTLHDPSSRNAEDWMNIMRKMGPKAKLDEYHYKYVSAYLVSKSK
jgi:cytochrome c5